MDLRRAHRIPLGLLHPRGVIRHTLLVGGSASPAEAGGAVDAIVIAPSRVQSSDPSWRAICRATLRERLAEDGIAYVLSSAVTRPAIERLCRSAGLVVGPHWLHLPSVESGTFLVPPTVPALVSLLSIQIPVRRRLRRLLGLALAAPGVARAVRRWAPHVGFVARRAAAPPALDWLYGALGRPPSDSITLRLNWRRRDVPVVFTVHSGLDPRPLRIVKTAFDAATARRRAAESAIVSALGPAAERSGALVPAFAPIVGEPPRPLSVQGVLDGESFASLLWSRPARLRQLVEPVAAWLLRWNLATRRSAIVGADELAARVVEPVALVLPPGPSLADYLAWLAALARRAATRPMPRVVTHGDLSMKNVLLLSGGRLGIIDWEEAQTEGFPLTDLVYTIYEAAVAAHGYDTGPTVLRRCFAADGEHSGWVRKLVRAQAAALDLDSVQLELCVHATWGMHAANEAARLNDEVPRPFRSNLSWVMERRDSLGAWLTN
jgi:hypothetical protein